MKPRVLTYKAKCPINTHGPALSACLWWLQLLQGRLQSRPRQRCTTYARREPVHRIEYRTPFRAHCFRNSRGARLDDRQEMPEQQFHLGSRHAFDHFAHDRGRRHRDAATGALKTDIGKPVVDQPDTDDHLIAAKRIRTRCLLGRIDQRAVIARVSDVIHDERVVQIWGGHGSFARCRHIGTALALRVYSTARIRVLSHVQARLRTQVGAFQAYNKSAASL
ncbi:MAG: hypothetical protein JWN13_5969 [Betaproteobacteria bacterium]|nr:hypothetical protein [Betaproteobacteria bacterium]